MLTLLKSVLQAVFIFFIAAIIIFGFSAFAQQTVIVQEQSLSDKIQNIMFSVFLVLGMLTIVASFLSRIALAIAKLTASPEDDVKVGKIVAVVNSVSQFLLELCQLFPTIGVNPKTAQMKKELEQLKANSEGKNEQVNQ